MAHDLNSKWPEICPTSHTETSRIIEVLEDLFVRWGLPSTIVTDNGPQFVSGQLESFLEKKGIQHIRTSLYHPQANGGVERFNQVVK